MNDEEYKEAYESMVTGNEEKFDIFNRRFFGTAAQKIVVENVVRMADELARELEKDALQHFINNWKGV